LHCAHVPRVLSIVAAMKVTVLAVALVVPGHASQEAAMAAANPIRFLFASI